MKKILFLLFAFGMIAFTQASTITGVVSNDQTCTVQPPSSDVIATDVAVLTTDYTLMVNYSIPGVDNRLCTASISTTHNFTYNNYYVQDSTAEGVFTYQLPPIPIRPALAHEIVSYQKNAKNIENISVGYIRT